MVFSQMAGWMLIIFSPFIAFTVNGRVSGENWMPAVIAAAVGLGWMLYEAYRYKKKCPPEAWLQRKEGKCFPALEREAEKDVGDLLFYGKKGERAAVLLKADGVHISAAVHAGSSWKIAKENLSAHYISGFKGYEVDYVMHIRWDELAEWQVRSDSDGPNTFRLVYQNGLHTDILRPYADGIEPLILDWVRSGGQCPVRLFDEAR